MISRHMERLTPSQFDRKLYVIYLLNDILFATLKKRSPSVHDMDQFATSLLPHLLTIIRHGYVGHAAGDQAKLMKILRQWGERDVFPPHVIDKVEADTINAPSPPPHTTIVTPSAAAALLASVTTPSSSSSAPVTASSLSTLLHLGPGFIVTLTKQYGSNVPYSLLDPLKIPPSLPREYNTPPDRHLLDILDDFYKEVRDTDEPANSSSGSSGGGGRVIRNQSQDNDRHGSRSRSRSRSPSPAFGGASPERRRRRPTTAAAGGGGGTRGGRGGGVDRSRSPSTRHNNNNNTNNKSRERDASSSSSRHNISNNGGDRPRR
jgi:hypothetical protein